jgi:hypothetical protein
MANFVHWPAGRAVLALPGQDVVFVLGVITPNQLLQHRPSYVNAILIQSRGQQVPGGCLACRSARPGLRPFPECRRLLGYFGGCCGNCKWHDHTVRCIVRDDNVVDLDDEDDDPPGSRRRKWFCPVPNRRCGNSWGDNPKYNCFSLGMSIFSLFMEKAANLVVRVVYDTLR